MQVGRFLVVVLDGVGVGELPDADAYGDAGSSTLTHTAQAVGGLRLPNLGRLGLGSLAPVLGVPPDPAPLASYGRLREASPGKDSVTGHWEMMGVVLERPLPTYPSGFPPEIVDAFERSIGRAILGNCPASGTQIIARLGDEHVRTRAPIVYTSADSVFQVAAHEDVIPTDELYRMCRIARNLLAGPHGVGRVIARPFAGTAGAYHRTSARRDFPIEPPRNLIDELAAEGHAVHAVGKIHEFFAGRGISQWDDTRCNADHVEALAAASAHSTASLVFGNLEDFDMLYGHRNDPPGLAAALEAFDRELPRIMEGLADNDVLILTSDHGNDPTTPSTDHSREHALMLAYRPSGRGASLGDRAAFADIAATVRDGFALPAAGMGRSFLDLIW